MIWRVLQQGRRGREREPHFQDLLGRPGMMNIIGFENPIHYLSSTKKKKQHKENNKNNKYNRKDNNTSEKQKYICIQKKESKQECWNNFGRGLIASLCSARRERATHCVGEGFVSRPHLLGEVQRGSNYLTSGKLKGRRNCLRMMKNERRKMKVMKRSKKSERTLTSCMDGMRQTLGHLEPCDVCKEWVWLQKQNKD